MDDAWLTFGNLKSYANAQPMDVADPESWPPSKESMQKHWTGHPMASSFSIRPTKGASAPISCWHRRTAPGSYDRLVALPIQMTPTFELGEPEFLFETEFPLIYESRYSVTADGQRFLLYSRTKRPEMTVMLNWTAALDR